MNQVASRIHKALEENELGVVRELPNELLLRSLPSVRVCSDPDSILFVSGRRAQSLKPSWTALQSKAGFDGDEKREYAEVKLTRALFNTRTFRMADSESAAHEIQPSSTRSQTLELTQVEGHSIRK